MQANLPYIEDDGVIVVQSNACLIHLGSKFGMMGSNQREESECDQLLCEVMDLRNAMVGIFYGGGRLPSFNFFSFFFFINMGSYLFIYIPGCKKQVT